MHCSVQGGQSQMHVSRVLKKGEEATFITKACLTPALTILVLDKWRQVDVDRKQNLVSKVILPPQNLQHGLHRVGNFVVRIWGMALQLFIPLLIKHANGPVTKVTHSESAACHRPCSSRQASPLASPGRRRTLCRWVCSPVQTSGIRPGASRWCPSARPTGRRWCPPAESRGAARTR